MAKKALLMILDGWGIGKHGKGDVIYNTPTPSAVIHNFRLQAKTWVFPMVRWVIPRSATLTSVPVASSIRTW